MRSVITRGLLKIPPRSLFPFVTEPWAGDDGMSGWWSCGAYTQQTYMLQFTNSKSFFYKYFNIFIARKTFFKYIFSCFAFGAGHFIIHNIIYSIVM